MTQKNVYKSVVPYGQAPYSGFGSENILALNSGQVLCSYSYYKVSHVTIVCSQYDRDSLE